MTFKDKVGLIPAIIVGGYDLWVDPPRKVRLTVDPDFEDRRRRQREEMEARHGPFPRVAVDPRMVHRLPPSKRIHMDAHYAYDGRALTTPCTVSIDLERRRIDFDRTTSWLFGREHKGSGAIGVALFSAPFMLLAAPALYAVNRFYRNEERRHGMSRHGIALLRALKGQIDAETEGLLIEALRNSWAHERAMARRVTLEEAKAVLDGCDLLEEHAPATGPDDADARGFHWFDDLGDQVASGSFYGQRDHFVHVLGSHFEDADADALVARFRTRKTREAGADDDT